MPTESPPPPPPPPPAKNPDDEENAEPAWLHSDNVQNSKGKQEVEESEEEEEESDEEDSDDDEEDSDEEESDDDEEESDEEEGEDSEEEESGAEDEESKLLSPDWSEDRRKRRRGKKKSNSKSLKTDEKNKKPGRNCCHSFFVLIQMVAICCNLAMIAVQLVPIYFWKKMVLEQKVVRCYVAFFDLIFILAEIEIVYRGLNNWIAKGLMYSFVGVLALDQRVSMIHYGFLNPKTSASFGDTWNELWTTIFIEATSWSMIGVGSLYFLMGVFCMKRLRNKYRAEYQKKLKEYKKSMQKSK